MLLTPSATIFISIYRHLLKGGVSRESLPFMTGAFRARYGGIGPLQDAAGLELLHLEGGKEFWQLMKLTSKNASGFTSLLELPLTQAVELLHFNDSSSLLEGIARSSVIAHKLGTLYSNSNLDKVKTEPGETDSSQPLVKTSSKKKNKSSGENEKLSYVHVRAHRDYRQNGRRLIPRLKLPQDVIRQLLRVYVVFRMQGM
ncbi:Transcription factor bHLH60 [Raphanus sativus]|nr:Transcription factor bHLH60 [Raphanus sativus]